MTGPVTVRRRRGDEGAVGPTALPDSDRDEINKKRLWNA